MHANLISDIGSVNKDKYKKVANKTRGKRQSFDRSINSDTTKCRHGISIAVAHTDIIIRLQIGNKSRSRHKSFSA